MVVRVMNSRLLFLRFLCKIVKANNQRTDSFSLVCCAKCSFVPKAKPDSCKITFPALSGFCCSSFFFFISRISFSIFYNQKEFGPLEVGSCEVEDQLHKLDSVPKYIETIIFSPVIEIFFLRLSNEHGKHPCIDSKTKKKKALEARDYIKIV